MGPKTYYYFPGAAGAIKFSRSLHRDREHSAVSRQHQEAAEVQGDGRRADCAAVGGDARCERTILARQQVDVSLEVTDHDITAESKRAAHAPTAHLVLFPDAGTAPLV